MKRTTLLTLTAAAVTLTACAPAQQSIRVQAPVQKSIKTNYNYTSFDRNMLATINKQRQVNNICGGQTFPNALSLIMLGGTSKNIEANYISRVPAQDLKFKSFQHKGGMALNIKRELGVEFTYMTEILFTGHDVGSSFKNLMNTTEYCGALVSRDYDYATVVSSGNKHSILLYGPKRF